MRENKALKCYEYLAIYVDDLCIAAQNPDQIIQTLKKDYKLKVKGDGPLSHHLGAEYIRDKDNTLVCQPKKYIDRLIESYHSMFKQDPPKNMRTPLDKNDHPELDDNDLLNGESIQHYLTMISQLQWLVTLVTEVWILQGICPLKDEWVFGCSLKTRLADQTKDSTTEVVMVK